MTQKRKLSYEQSLALDRGRSVAHANQRRRVAANQAAEKAQAEREAAKAAEAARLRELRGGFELGDRVRGRERTFGSIREGVVVEGEPSELFQGVHVRDDEGHVWTLARNSVVAA